MRVAIAADHAGFELKRDLAGHIAQQGHDVTDLGTHSTAQVDYPDMAEAVATAVRNGQADRGLLVCGSGAGVSVAASKFPGIRAAVCHDTTSARLARQHNDANVLALGARLVGSEVAKDCLRTFLATAFEGGRHARRVAKLG